MNKGLKTLLIALIFVSKQTIKVMNTIKRIKNIGLTKQMFRGNDVLQRTEIES